jgi:hypothetical protein
MLQGAVFPSPPYRMGVVDRPCHYFPRIPAKRRPALGTPHLVAPFNFMDRRKAFRTWFSIGYQQFQRFHIFFVALMCMFRTYWTPASLTYFIIAYATLKGQYFDQSPAIWVGAGAQEPRDFSQRNVLFFVVLNTLKIFPHCSQLGFKIHDVVLKVSNQFVILIFFLEAKDVRNSFRNFRFLAID